MDSPILPYAFGSQFLWESDRIGDAMSEANLEQGFSDWLDIHMIKGRARQANVPARLVTLLGLMERLREDPTLNLGNHVQPNGQQLIKHDKYVKAALKRFAIASP